MLAGSSGFGRRLRVQRCCGPSIGEPPRKLKELNLCIRASEGERERYKLTRYSQYAPSVQVAQARFFHHHDLTNLIADRDNAWYPDAPTKDLGAALHLFSP